MRKGNITIVAPIEVRQETEDVEDFLEGLRREVHLAAKRKAQELNEGMKNVKFVPTMTSGIELEALPPPAEAVYRCNVCGAQYEASRILQACGRDMTEEINAEMDTSAPPGSFMCPGVVNQAAV